MDLRHRIWELMGDERRLAAAKAFWDNAEQKGAHRQVEQLLAQRLHARPVFVKRLPNEKKAAYVARDMATAPYLWEAAMISYHFSKHRPMLVDFLNALGIANDNGHYENEANTTPPTAEKLEEAVQAILAKYDRTDVLVYLGVVALQDPVFWANLQPIVDRLLAEPAAA